MWREVERFINEKQIDRERKREREREREREGGREREKDKGREGGERERERQRISWDIDKTGERIFINMHSDQNECILEDRSRSTIRKSPVFGFHSENEK